MGGNTRAINRITGKTIALAEKMDFTKIDRAMFTRETKNLFYQINKLYFEKFNIPIWLDLNIIEDGRVFNGSSVFLFDKNIPDAEFVKYKSKVGDIDITIPVEKLENLFELLSTLENQEIISGIKYLGQNKKEQNGYQINALFEFFSGRERTPFQVDFEGVIYDTTGSGGENYPSEFAKFSHSSDWNDIKCGIKGVGHKYLLQNIVRGLTKRTDIVILTPKSPIVEGKIRPKVMHEPAREYAFSVDRGLRKKLYPLLDENNQVVFYENKACFKELTPEESSYFTDLKDIFENLFSKKPTEEEIQKLHSYLGLLDLTKEYLTEAQIKDVYEFMILKNLWGKQAQKLDRDSWKEDLRIKHIMVVEFLNRFSYLRIYNIKIRQLIKEFYQNYGRNQ